MKDTIPLPESHQIDDFLSYFIDKIEWRLIIRKMGATLVKVFVLYRF